MHPGLWVSKTGLEAQQRHVAAITNNLANVNTVGFKSDRVNFETLLYQVERQAGAQSSQNTEIPTGLNLGTGVRVVSTDKSFSQGSIKQTSNPLDIAVNGKGFLQVLRPDGTIAYTRDGQLHKNSNGQLVTANGYEVSPSITIPNNATSITIGNDGIVSVTTAGTAAATQVGTIQLADFINPAGLQPIGENEFLETAASGTPQVGAPGSNGVGTIAQGALESSNVSTVEALVSLIEGQRATEIGAKAMQSVSEQLQFLIQNVD